MIRIFRGGFAALALLLVAAADTACAQSVTTINNLAPATLPLAGSETFPLWQLGATKNVTANNLLPNSGVTAATYGDATHCWYATIGANGLITSATNSTSCPGGGGGSGTVNSGTLGQLAYYAGAGTAVSGVGPGTTTTVLHGNASGAPSYGAVSLTADVTGILPGANGGTGNGFFAATGPTTSLKTFTFPNASATVLTSNAAVTIAQGGTGLTSAGAAEITALCAATGTPSSSTFLRGDCAWATPAGSGNVTGPGSAVSGNIATYNGTTGTIIQDGGIASAALVTLTGTQTLTNKTLTAPNLGTPSAIALNNATAGSLPLVTLATQTADTVVMNATAGTASPTAVSVPACANDGVHALVYASHVLTCASISGGGVSVTAGSPNIVITPSPGTGTFTVGSTTPNNAQTGTSYAIASSDAGKIVTGSNASAQAYTIVAASTTNFTAGFGFDLQNINSGAITLTATTSVFDNGLPTLVVTKGQDAFISSDSTNYHTAVTMPVVATNTILGNSSGSSNYPTAQTVGTGVLTALGNNLSAAGGVTSTIASGTAAMGTGAITSATCATVVTVSATNVATTDTVLASFNGDPTAVTGYVPATAGMLTIIGYPTSGNVNFKVCNNTSGSITPGALTLNWRVVR